ncbi:hypothetical protein CPJCM30710_12090 [Clostridium polyendosporum]|uniref:Uncharacterized protein n=1 Tax=Clostridium polyendosporum TaxID=69208 RepID=A0A919RZM3_9CLOT|nr:hypothetical protein [Clostridium polyendosporum]GIM28543.1 hypothetical protein CPJCM30710_12090 [Clostridium polyendosporum]
MSNTKPCETKTCEIKNQVNQIIETVENYTRTQRHLEQNQDITSEEQKHQADRIQNERREEINNLTNKVVYGDNYNVNDKENLKENYEKAQTYMKYNAEHMSSEDLSNLKEKQMNRKEHLRNT